MMLGQSSRLVQSKLSIHTAQPTHVPVSLLVHSQGIISSLEKSTSGHHAPALLLGGSHTCIVACFTNLTHSVHCMNIFTCIEHSWPETSSFLKVFLP